MSKLNAELNRLYGMNPGQDVVPDALGLTGAVRVMVLEIAAPADWQAMAMLWQGVQADLSLPAPAIAVNGINGYQLWFSLQEPLPSTDASRFLAALRRRYLANIAPARLRLLPTPDITEPIRAVPSCQPGSGHWSAFVSSDLAAMFADDPWLDLPPNPDAQANLLSRIQSITPSAFLKAVEQLTPVPLPAKAPALLANHSAASQPASANPQEPVGFLLGVMNDATQDIHWRIEAAKALLPYFPAVTS